MMRGLISISMLAVAMGCGPSTDDDADSGDSQSQGTTTGDTDDDASGSATSVGDGSGSEGEGSTGEDPEEVDLCDTELISGISGLALAVECDVGPPEECIFPATGRMIAVFAEDPRVEADDFFPSPLDPAITPVMQTASDGEGRFEFSLIPGTWVICAIFNEDGYCQTDVVIDAAQAIRTATHYSGNGDSWSVGTCPLR